LTFERVFEENVLTTLVVSCNGEITLWGEVETFKSR